MKDIVLPQDAKEHCTGVSRDELKEYLRQAENRPVIKEQLILKMYEVADKIKRLYDLEDVVVLEGEDQTGKYLCCINKSGENISLSVPLTSLQLVKEYSAYCVLSGEALELSDKTFRLKIPRLDAILVKLTPVE